MNSPIIFLESVFPTQNSLHITFSRVKKKQIAFSCLILYLLPYLFSERVFLTYIPSPLQIVKCFSKEEVKLVSKITISIHSH